MSDFYNTGIELTTKDKLMSYVYLFTFGYALLLFVGIYTGYRLRKIKNRMK